MIKTKTLWLAHAIPYPPKAGFLLRSYNLLKELAKNHSVDLIAFVQEPWVRTLFGDVAEGLRESRRALEEFCPNVHFLPIDKLNRSAGKQRTALESLVMGSSYTASWLHSRAARTYIEARLNSTKYDLIHFDTIGLAGYRDLVRSTPSTLMHHNIESHMMLRRAQNTSNPIAKLYYQHEGRLIEDLEQQSTSTFARHITCSDLDTERLRQLAPSINVTTIPNGVDCDYFSPSGAEKRPQSLVFVGTMNWYPNVDAMLFFMRDIWPALRRQIPNITLDIAGSNPPDSITRLGQTLPGVTVHGYVDDVRPMIDSAEIFICPIRDGGGTKLKILDAFAMKKCVIAHPIACEGISVTDSQNVIFASQPEEFVARIAELLGDPSRRTRIGIAARELVERDYSFRAIGKDFSRIMTETAATTRASD